ncbi:Amidohydrolase [Frankia sp. AiPs1]|nr:amidohydrolase family protein [Frankia sp. AiPa1]
MVVLANARIFDGHAMRPGTGSVVVDGNIITAVGETAGHDGNDVIDVGGMTVMPGLITSHLHPDFYKFDIFSGEKPGKELPPGVMMAIGVRTCRVLLESGFTGYAGAGCAHDIDAQLKMAIAQDIIPGPRIRACGHHIGTTGDMNNRSRWWKGYETPGIDLCGDGPDAIRTMVRREISRGVEIIKVFAGAGHGIPSATSRNIARDELSSLVRTAHERGARVRAHVADKEMILECLDLGVDIIDHGDEIDQECLDLMVAAGTFWVPSLVYLWSLLEIGYATRFGVNPALYDHVREMLPIAQQAGVRILIGDDYSGVFRTMIKDDPLDHQVGNYGREFAFYSEIDGLSSAEVLTWGTSNAGQLLVDAPATVGVIAPGALADLIVVDGDPLADPTVLSRPDEALKAVFRDGVLVIDYLPTSKAPTERSTVLGPEVRR